MNKKGSSADQFFRFALIAFLAMWAFNQFFAKPKTNNPDRPALPVLQAFKGIDPAQGPALNTTTANAELKTLQTQVDKNPQDPLAYWSRLRMALIHQYTLNDLKTATRKGGFLGFGPKVNYFPAYDDIITHSAGDAVDAQALFQVGDLEWRQSTQGTKKAADASSEAITSLEALIHRGRGKSAFLDLQIVVPQQIDPKKVPLVGIPSEGFHLVKVADLSGNPQKSNPQGLTDRLNDYYSGTFYYKLFDSVVNVLGADPRYSYGLAILFFAITMRVVMHPIYKRQYESMKGMALIAPQMKQIQEQYKGKSAQTDQMAMMKEIQALQRQHGVNPTLGCALGVMQMPIFFWFVSPLIQHYEPKLDLVGASFLWMHSLGHPDIPLLIMYAISMFLSFRLSSTPPADDMQRQQQLIMSFIFPIMFPVFIAGYPAAFTMYWMTYNAVSTLFQWRLAKAADPTKDLWRTLSFAELRTGDPTADSVPQRPKPSDRKNAKVETLNPAALNGHSNGSANGSANGNGNAKPKAALEGSVLESLENSSDKNSAINGSNKKPRKKSS